MAPVAPGVQAMFSRRHGWSAPVAILVALSPYTLGSVGGSGGAPRLCHSRATAAAVRRACRLLTVLSLSLSLSLPPCLSLPAAVRCCSCGGRAASERYSSPSASPLSEVGPPASRLAPPGAGVFKSPSTVSNWSTLATYVESLRGRDQAGAKPEPTAGEQQQQRKREPHDCFPAGCYDRYGVRERWATDRVGEHGAVAMAMKEQQMYKGGEERCNDNT